MFCTGWKCAKLKRQKLRNTTSCFYIVQGNKNTSASFVVDIAKKLVDLTVRCCGGEVSYLYVPEGEISCNPLRNGV